MGAHRSPTIIFGVKSYFSLVAVAIGAILMLATPVRGLAAGASQSYILQPGDQLSITVYGEQSLSLTVTLLPDGTITYPLVGKLHFGGETVDTATRQLKAALEGYIRNPIVSIGVTQTAPDDVLVLGDVKTPGKYTLPSTARVADAIAAAGGLDDINGDYPVARVSINDSAPESVSLQDLLRDGDASANVQLGSSAIVYVPGPTPMRVQVVGSVDKPGTVQVHVGDRLSMAVALAGTSSASQADLSHIRVTRVAPDGSTSAQEYNLYKALKGGDLSSDPVLNKNDVIYVPQARNGSQLSGFAQGVLLLLSRLVIPF
jgi:protein involved in polysaccharide export with SLBB domain